MLAAGSLLTTLLCCLFQTILAQSQDLPCDPPCGDHGTCKADHGSLTCRCSSNWFGPSCNIFICQHDADICGDGQCMRDSNNSTSYLCSCPFPTLGDHCQYTVGSNSCDTVNCSGRGICYGKQASPYYECVCDPGYFGENCQFQGNSTCLHPDVQNCYGHGMCTVFQGNHGILSNCMCDTDADGNELYIRASNCEILWSSFECRNNPCQNNGICEALPISLTSYECKCPLEWTGRHCNVSFDTCGEDQCKNGATCVPVAGGHYFRCDCLLGYTGQKCEISVATMEVTKEPTMSLFTLTTLSTRTNVEISSSTFFTYVIVSAFIIVLLTMALIIVSVVAAVLRRKLSTKKPHEVVYENSDIITQDTFEMTKSSA